MAHKITPYAVSVAVGAASAIIVLIIRRAILLIIIVKIENSDILTVDKIVDRSYSIHFFVMHVSGKNGLDVFILINQFENVD